MRNPGSRETTIKTAGVMLEDTHLGYDPSHSNGTAEGRVYCEPLSARIPCYTGKIQGNLHVLTGQLALSRPPVLIV
jgi:hypothetical protein